MWVYVFSTRRRCLFNCVSAEISNVMYTHRYRDKHRPQRTLTESGEQAGEADATAKNAGEENRYALKKSHSKNNAQI